MEKRTDYLSWDDYFMQIALISAKRSKDPSTQVGSVIVDENNIILSIGYNGFPRGCDDDVFPWHKDLTQEENKYLYVVHAEQNAIVNSKQSLKNSKMYCTLFPCNECAKLIIQAGIKHVFYIEQKSGIKTLAAIKMFKHAGVSHSHFDTSL